MTTKLTLSFCAALLASTLCAQQPSPLWTLDFVKSKSGKRAEMLFYLENNWKIFRDSALLRGHISAYRLLETAPDSLGNFDFVLMTAYPDSAAFAQMEANFQPIMKAARPNGPMFLNQTKPGEFREGIFGKDCHTIFEAQASAPQPIAVQPESVEFLKEVNRDIWVPFSESWAANDGERYASLHAPSFIRATGGKWSSVNDHAGYAQGIRDDFKNRVAKGEVRHIDFRFFERVADANIASERGIYKVTAHPGTEREVSFYGRFHTFSKKENGRWRFVVDYDSDEGGIIGEDDFRAARRLDEWQ